MRDIKFTPGASSSSAVVPHRPAAGQSEITAARDSQEMQQSSQLQGLTRRHRREVEMRRIQGTPDSQTGLLASRGPSPNSPLSDHIMAGQLQNIVRASMGELQVTGDVETRLVENAGVLREKGFDTAEAVKGLLKTAWRHDATLAVGMLGLTGNAGYAIGMEAANEKLVAMLPPDILRNPSLVGMLVGLGVGGLDVMISVMGKAAVTPLIYNGSDGNGKLPESVKVPSGAEAIMASMKLATTANFLKNAPRMGAPAIQAFAEHHFNGVTNSSIQRLTADRVDVALDAGLGFAASAAVQFKNLTGATGYEARMLLRSDLGEVIDKMQGSYQDSLVNMAKGVGSALMQPAVPLAVVGTIGFFISELFAANSMIDSAGHSPGGSHGQLPADRADWSVMTGKRASSVALMALMTATIEIGAPIVGAGAQALSGAVKDAAGSVAGKVASGATSAAAFLSQSAGQVPNIGSWVAQRLGLQPQAEAAQAAADQPESSTQAAQQPPRHAVRIEELPV
jgi:hypothetical protein